jgi:hypothetical protein
MESLYEVLNRPGNRPIIIREAITLLDSEVQRKRGISGFAVRQGFGVVRQLQGGGLLHRAVDGLLDEFTAALEPFFAQWQALEPHSRPPLDQWLPGVGGVAEALLQITDRRRQRIDNAVVTRAYDALRGTALRHVEEAVPGIGELIGRFVD